jgi:hypothetical protein
MIYRGEPKCVGYFFLLHFSLSVTAHPPLGQNAITSAMPTDPVAGERVGRHGAIEPSG